MNKKWYLSKVLWVSVLTTVVGVAQVVTALVSKQSIDANGVFEAAMGIGTVVLRVWFTDTKLVK